MTDRGGAPAIVSFGGGPRGARWTAARACAVAVLALAAACVRTTTVTYLPNREQPRLSLADGQALLAQFVGVECERLRGAARAAAETRVLVRVDSAGQASSSELAGSTGDGRVDGLIGAVAAQLRLEAGADRLELRAGYRCADEGGVAVTLERWRAP